MTRIVRLAWWESILTILMPHEPFRLAERRNDPRIAFQLARVLRKTPEGNTEATRLYQSSADQGYAPAQFRLGVMYVIQKDYTQEKHWLEFAAKQGDVDAQNNLGIM